VATGEQQQHFHRGGPESDCIAWSPDGRLLACGSRDRNIYVWDVAADRRLVPFEWSGGVICCLAFSPDGATLAAGGYENPNNVVGDESLPGVIRLWELATRKSVHRLVEHSEFVESIGFLPDGKRLVSIGWDDTLRIWDLETGRNTATQDLRSGCFSGLAISPDGQTLATASAQVIEVWQTDTLKQLRQWRGGPGLCDLCFSPNGKTLLSGACRLAPWDVATGRERMPRDAHRGPVYSAVFTPDGRQVISSGDTTVRFWDVASAEQVRKLDVRSKWRPYAPLILTPDGKAFATPGSDNVVRFWDVETAEQLPGGLEHEGDVVALAVSPDGEVLVSSSYEDRNGETQADSNPCRLNYWHLPTGHKTNSFEFSHLFGIAFSNDGTKWMTSSPGTIRVLAWPSADELLTVKLPAPFAAGSFSSDGRLVAAATRNKQRNKTFVGCWDVARRRRLWRARQEVTFGPVAFSPDGMMVASTDMEGNVYLWSADKGRKLAEFHGHHDQVRCLVFSPDSRRLLSGGRDTMMLLWDVESIGKEKSDTS
jgi:WD40 repeat protein